MQAIVIAHNQEDGALLSYLLRQAGLAVAVSRDAQRVIPTLAERPVDLLLISTGTDPDLPKTVHEVRQVAQIPLLLLVDPLTEDAHCALLDAGVDMVLERPCSTRLLSRYIRRLLARTTNIPASVLPVIEVNGCVLNPTQRTVLVQEEAQHLTQLEFRLLYILMTNSGHVFTTDELVERVWGYSGEGNRGLVRGLVRRLRRKIEPVPEEPRLIENLPGVGYRFTAE
ncbi:MAG: response regulator transcription factor [Anaerolineales bacterium]|nr:response regulator transcription factor [Anaerolineales bacterium]